MLSGATDFVNHRLSALDGQGDAADKLKAELETSLAQIQTVLDGLDGNAQKTVQSKFQTDLYVKLINHCDN